MKTNAVLGICPMSINIIDATIKYAKKNNEELMLIASRRQVETDLFGGSYVFNTNDFTKYIKSKNPKNILICRDHGGPYMGYNEENLTYAVAMERAKKSFEMDIKAGFDLLHLDCSLCKGTEKESVLKLLQYCNEFSDKILFEIGTEENIGTSASKKKFEDDLSFFTKYKKPEFIVGQTGSLVKETFQAGIFDLPDVKQLVGIAHTYGVKFKEHNADYLTQDEIVLRAKAGVDAINIGPQLATTQTRIMLYFAKEYGFDEELQAFINVAVGTNKWKKWLYGLGQSTFRLGIISGHYAYDTDEYEILYKKLANEMRIDSEIEQGIVKIIYNYVEGMK